MQSYLDDAAVFLSALEELQGQLSTVERHRDALQPKEADVLKRVLEKVRRGRPAPARRQRLPLTASGERAAPFAMHPR